MNILTFDIEEWFHILDNDSTKDENKWLEYDVRIHENLDRILEFLQQFNLRATFFVVGWIAKKYPEVVIKIANCGYEIGSHTHMHQLMYNQTYNEVEEDLIRSIKVLEDLSGKKVRSFRAPGFSITKNNKWVFEILANNGISIDCSVFPASRAHGGFPQFVKDVTSILSFNQVKIKEFPINTVNLFGMQWIFSGGGYFRITPYFLIKMWSKKSKYIMTYFHQRDFDYLQPVIKELPLIRKFKSYVGLKSCIFKLEKWIHDFEFIDLNDADKIVDWDNAPVVKL